MKITADIGNLDYDTIIRNALPLLKEKKDNKLIDVISDIVDMPGDLAMKMIAAIPRETKDQLVAYIINHKKKTVMDIITKSLSKRGFPLEITDLEISAD